MDEEQRRHLEDLLRTYQRRLRHLEKRAAALGLNTPPEVLVEIEDIRTEIERIEIQLQPVLPFPFSVRTTTVPSQQSSTSSRRGWLRSQLLGGAWWLIILLLLLIIVFFWQRGDVSRIFGIFPSSTLPGRIAFVSDSDGDNEIYVINPDGSGRVPLTHNECLDTAPAWSPDGKYIAFVSDCEDEDEEIYVMNADGTQRQRLTRRPGRDGVPTWSPDGQYIAFQSLRMDSGKEDFEIYRIYVGGGESDNLTNDPERWNTFPAWSSDGRYIAFVAPNSNSKLQIYLLDTDSDNVIESRTQSNVCSNGPAWSSDSTYIAFVSNPNVVTCLDGSLKVYIMTADGSDGPVRLTDWDQAEGVPTWAPDGQHIAFQVGPDGNRAIYFINLIRKEPIPLVKDNHNNYWPAWSPASR